MSSTLRSVAQIPARIKYLVAVANSDNDSTNLADDECFAFQCDAAAFAESSTVVSTFTPAGISNYDYNAGQLFKDLGRQVVVYDASTKLHVAIYREVQPVEGADTEGVGEDGAIPIFIRVWAADGAGVRVARTGPGAH
jgi:hypothetical protein